MACSLGLSISMEMFKFNSAAKVLCNLFSQRTTVLSLS